MFSFKNIVGFEWDKGNKTKNFEKHKVNETECEEVFFDSEKKILKDTFHSKDEERFILIGKTISYHVENYARNQFFYF